MGWKICFYYFYFIFLIKILSKKFPNFLFEIENLVFLSFISAKKLQKWFEKFKGRKVFILLLAWLNFCMLFLLWIFFNKLIKIKGAKNNGIQSTSSTILIPKCSPLEEFLECGTACPASCSNLNPACTKQCVPGCFCFPGLVRGPGGNCTPISQCPTFSANLFGSNLPMPANLTQRQWNCIANEEHRTCGTPGCEPSCWDPFPNCGSACQEGCYCKLGFVRSPSGACVKFDDCDKQVTGSGKNDHVIKFGSKWSRDLILFWKFSNHFFSTECEGGEAFFHYQKWAPDPKDLSTFVVTRENVSIPECAMICLEKGDCKFAGKKVFEVFLNFFLSFEKIFKIGDFSVFFPANGARFSACRISTNARFPCTADLSTSNKVDIEGPIFIYCLHCGKFSWFFLHRISADFRLIFLNFYRISLDFHEFLWISTDFGEFWIGG